MSRLTIIGTGFVGTSLGLALKARKLDVEIVGHDRDHGRALAAKKLGAVDRAEWSLPAAVEKASMVIVATPLGAIEQIFTQIAEFLAPGCVVTDTASLKGPTLEWAGRALGGRASYVGGHPILGRVGDDRKPSATLFQDRTYCIIAGADASTTAVDQVLRLVAVLGARPLFLDPLEHDSHIAALDQLPSLLAAALLSVATASPAWRDGQRLAGAAFEAARAQLPTDVADLAIQYRLNRVALERWVRELQKQLDELLRLLEEEPSGLDDLLAATRKRCDAWKPGHGPSIESPVDLPRPRDQFARWLFGGLGSRRHR